MHVETRPMRFTRAAAGSRGVPKWLACFGLAVLLVISRAQAETPDPLFQKVVDQAARAAATPYLPPETSLPAALSDLTYDQYRSIRFRKDLALWQDSGLFAVEFLHPGFLYGEPVAIHAVDENGPRKVTFDPGLFTHEGLNLDPAPRAEGLGFAGFRVHYPLHRPDYKDEVTVFLGASYFRLLGRDQAYGISARGIAVNTGLPSGEEFPSFREFWLVKPAPDATTFTLYAYLDGPSLAGAYRFDIEPGRDTRVRVKARLFFRDDVDRLGIAPLTSMYLSGENDPKRFDDFRHEIHDSDGLLIQARDGGWIWRPLANPRQLRISAFTADDPVGFGLMQRDRDFEHYLDMDANYQKRPGLWVEPTGGHWGDGNIQLIEIPTASEINDNIVAFWVPARAPRAGDQLALSYTLHAVRDWPIPDGLGRVSRTRTGSTFLPGTASGRPDTQRRIVVEFAGDALAALHPTQPVTADLTTTSGEIFDVVVSKVPTTGHWRVAFRLAPEGREPADMRLSLSLRGRGLTETWNYIWSSHDLD